MARILVADDDSQIASLVAMKLRLNGHEVVVVANGHEAIEAVDLARPDLCILDVMMPGMDGFQVLAALRARPDLAGLPIVLLTALGEEKHVVRAFKEKANDFVVKPFSPSELLVRVERLLAA
ncbi:MAG TPA: response regulator [Candidatus Limnocylindria bacterium]|nr:response regulator [Candidatus Limnocylindria bacterium]